MGALNDLFSMIHDYLLVALPKERKCSKNTIRSYRKSLELLLDFVKEKKHKALIDLTFEDIDRNMISDFLEHLEVERKCSIATRNQRLHCIRSFYNYAAEEDITVVRHLAEAHERKSSKGRHFATRYNNDYWEERCFPHVVFISNRASRAGVGRYSAI